MIPRGEVGIIFASIGLAEGVLGDNQYAALLIVVLVTTLITPPMLRWRVAKLQTASAAATADDDDEEWDLAVVGDRIVLRGRPASSLAVPLALQVAELAPNATPDSTVINWFGSRTDAELTWDPTFTAGLVDVLREGDPRSLRFLDVTGVLERALPEVGEALARRRADPGELDPTRILQLPTVQRVGHHADRRRSSARSSQTCARLARRTAPRPRGTARPDVVDTIVATVRGAGHFDGALANPDPLSESNVLQLAEHLANKEIVDAAYQLSAAGLDDDDWRMAELAAVRDRVLDALSHPELLDGIRHAGRHPSAGGDLVARPGQRAGRGPSRPGIALIPRVPRARRTRPAGDLAQHVPRRGVVRIVIDDGTEPGRGGSTCRAVTGLDLLARLTDSLAESRLDVVRHPRNVARRRCARLVPRPRRHTARSGPPDRADGTPAPGQDLARSARWPVVTFEDDVYPWHTLCTVSGGDRPGLLAAMAGALDAAKVDVHAATLLSYDGPHDRLDGGPPPVSSSTGSR